MDGRERLKAWMSENEHRQVDVARLVGTKQQNVSAWLRGRPMSLEMALRIRAVTGIPVEAWASDESGALPAIDDPHRCAS